MVWLEKIKPPLIQDFNNYISPFQKSQKNDISCIKCKKATDTCPYCFTEYFYEWLKLNNKELVESFLIFFNYDFDHTGYGKDMHS